VCADSLINIDDENDEAKVIKFSHSSSQCLVEFSVDEDIDSVV